MVRKEKGKMNERKLKKWSKLKNHDQEVPEKLNIFDIQKNFSEASTKIVILPTYQKKQTLKKANEFYWHKLLTLFNTQIYNLSSGPHSHRFSVVVAKKRKNFEQIFANLCFETSEHNVQTANLSHKHFNEL